LHFEASAFAVGAILKNVVILCKVTEREDSGMGNLLAGHIAVVTGGGSGIGRAISRGYAAEGATVAVADVNEAGAAETVAMIEHDSGVARSYALDVTDRDACKVFAVSVARDFGPVSILVNNAGIVRREKITAPDADADWDAVISVNLMGPYNVPTAFRGCLDANEGANRQSTVRFSRPCLPATHWP